MNLLTSYIIKKIFLLCFSFTDLFPQSQMYTNTSKMFILVLACNILAILAQGCGLFLHSFLNYKMYDPLTWILPIALVLSSCRWWGNYVSHYTCGNNKFLNNYKYIITAF